MVMIFSMNPSVDASIAMMITSGGSAFARWFYDCCLSSFESKDLCDEFISSVSQDSYHGRCFPRYTAASLTVVYSAGAGVVPKGYLRQRKASLYTIDMQVDAVIAFSCIWQ